MKEKNTKLKRFTIPFPPGKYTSGIKKMLGRLSVGDPQLHGPKVKTPSLMSSSFTHPAKKSARRLSFFRRI